MTRIDTWMKRFRGIGQKKDHERVLTRTSKFEVMTSTQAVRFRQLKRIGTGAKKKNAGDPRYKPHYSLPEACRTLGVPVNRALQSAVSGKLTCWLVASGLRGKFSDDAGDGASGNSVEMPDYLALTPEDCQTIETWGSANVHELEYPDAPVDGKPASPRFRLQEPLWVDPERVVLKHPLPDGFAT